MLRSLLKLALAGVILFAVYQALSWYFLFRLIDHFAACYPQSGMCALAEQNAPPAAIEQAAGQATACVSQRQGAVEAWFHPAPKPAELAASTASGGLTQQSRSELLDMCRSLQKRNTGGAPR